MSNPNHHRERDGKGLRRKLSWNVGPSATGSGSGSGSGSGGGGGSERPRTLLDGLLSGFGFARLRPSQSAADVGRLQMTHQAQLRLDVDAASAAATAAASNSIERDRPATALGLVSVQSENNNNNNDDDVDDDVINSSSNESAEAKDSAAPSTIDNLDEPEVPPQKRQKLYHNIAWAVSSELGYRNMISAAAHPTASNLVTTDFIRIPIHTQIEDIHWPSKNDRAMWAAQGLGGDHRIHGHHFEDGGVVTHEYDTTWNTSNSNALANSDETKKDEMMDSSKTEDFAAMSSSSINQYDIISESGSIMSDDQEDDDDVVMDIMNSKAGSAGAVDLMETSTASSDTESTLSSTNNSSMQQHDATETLTRRANTSSKRIFPSTETSRLFILADGHGGILASKFFVPRTKAILTDLLKTQSWDFSLPQHRLDFETRACEAFRIIDAEYCAIQVSRYRTWVDAGSIPSDRPDDDGCALVAVVIHNGWIVNLNVGDSRMTLHSRPRTERGAEKQPWSQVFTSTDHNMTHPAKVYSIYTSGGHFMSPSHTLIPMNPQHPSLRGDVPYNELANARIYRHASPAVKAVGVSHRRTLNLTGTMGDLLFKIEPAVLSPVPDVSFVELDKRWEYVMVLATDGIWDHLMDNSGDTERQVSMVMGVVEAAVMSVEAERDEYERAVEGYKREKREWKRREVERRRVLREERVQRRAVVAVGEGEVAIEGVAVAAEPERVVEMEDDDDEDGEEEGSVASSNGSTAVASKDTVKSKKTGENDGDEVEEEEEEEGLGSSSEASKPKVEEAKSEQQPQALEEDEDMLMMDDEDDIVVETPSATATSAAPHTQFLPTSTKLPPPTKPALFDFHAVMEDRLRQVSEVLVEREMGKNAEGRIHPAIVKAMQHLYWQKQIRYDDATAFVAYFD